ncbi:MAG: hypothetical protein N2446_00690 [Elusimicrobiales bacterium]|nr:hypothetical protein [Elusimicrobiales bacterium]
MKMSKPETIIYSSQDVITSTKLKNKKVIKPFEKIENGNVVIEGFQAYNVNKDFHSKKNDWFYN